MWVTASDFSSWRDLLENKRLILTMMAVLIFSLIGATLSPIPSLFVVFSLLIGLASTATQVIVPLAGHYAPEHKRGQIVGTVVSGLLFGILLARPLSTLIGGELGWRAMYYLSAVIMAAIMAMLAVALPTRQPAAGVGYGGLIRSLWGLLITQPILQRRAAYQSCMFAACMLFWISLPLLLQVPPFSLGHLALSAVMLSGVAGAFIAPFAGLADQGHTRATTGASIAMVIAGFAMIMVAGKWSVWVFVLAGILIDAGVQANMVVGQRAVLSISPELRGRLNALYLAVSFVFGACGSAVSGYAVQNGAVAVGLLGIVFELIAAAIFATEFRKPKSR